MEEIPYETKKSKKEVVPLKTNTTIKKPEYMELDDEIEIKRPAKISKVGKSSSTSKKVTSKPKKEDPKQTKLNFNSSKKDENKMETDEQ